MYIFRWLKFHPKIVLRHNPVSCGKYFGNIWKILHNSVSCGNISHFLPWFKLTLQFFHGHVKGNSNLLWGNCQMFFGKIIKYSLGELSNILWDRDVQVLFHHSMGPVLFHPKWIFVRAKRREGPSRAKIHVQLLTSAVYCAAEAWCSEKWHEK